MLLQAAAPLAAAEQRTIFSMFPRTPLALGILFILAVFSLLSWTLIVRKWLTFKEIGNQNRAFLELFRRSARLSEVQAACDRFRGTPLSGMFQSAYQELNAQLQVLRSKSSTQGGTESAGAVLSARGISGIQRSLQRAATAELTVLERNMSWLATAGSVTPFIGLLGTVIGIVNAFEGLGIEKTASIQAVAPGIAEALIATAAGLFAAIPAVIGYNHFVHKIKTVAAEMDDFSAEMLNLLERSFS